MWLSCGANLLQASLDNPIPGFINLRQCNAMRKVVVTGLGLVTPLGIGRVVTPSDKELIPANDLKASAERTRLIDGHCGIVSIRNRTPQFALLPSQVAAVVPEGSREDGKWNPKEHLSPGVGRISNAERTVTKGHLG